MSREERGRLRSTRCVADLQTRLQQFGIICPADTTDNYLLPCRELYQSIETGIALFKANIEDLTTFTGSVVTGITAVAFSHSHVFVKISLLFEARGRSNIT